MSEATQLERLRRAVLEQARQDAQQLLEQADAAASACLQRATVQAEQEAQQQLAAHKQQIALEMEHTAAQTQLEVQLFRLKQREALLQQVLEAAAAQLAEIATWPNYAEIVIRLAHEAVARVPAPNIVLIADPQAQRALDPKTLVAEFAPGVTLGPALATGLGVIARTSDGHRRYENTLTARLERLYPQLRAEIYALLAGDK